MNKKTEKRSAFRSEKTNLACPLARSPVSYDNDDMKLFNFQSLFLVFLLSAFQAEVLIASDAIDFTAIPIDKADTLDKYLYKVQSAGGIVIIDCLETDKMHEKPSILTVGDVLIVSTSFYELSFSNKVCVVYPKDENLRSKFLSTKIPSFTLKNSNLKWAVFLLGADVGACLEAMELHESQKVLNLDIKDETVEQILLDMSASYGSSRIVLSAGIDDHGWRTPDFTVVQFQ